ncbi:phosphomannomutase [Aestuariivirga sp.]|uniref:phosphomannomutase n=1 Tax=Aestuariivirga sp. TaxID=2650926 RepID=UPI0039E4CD50
MSARFGTSGLRGLATELTDGTAMLFSRAFARHLLHQGDAVPGLQVLVGGDLRESSPVIMFHVCAGLQAEGLVPVDCGAIPTPALAYAAMSRGLPAVMVTGSHIPAERNGLKFYRARGEISKSDETSIAFLTQDADFAAPPTPSDLVEAREGLGEAFVARLTRCFAGRPLTGLRVGVYEHSTVARDLLLRMIGDLGATPVPLGRSEMFIALDTEAVEPGVLQTLKSWIREHRLDAIVSADGDGDRPLLIDEAGKLLRGDVIGLLTAQFLRAGAVVTPLSSNSALEQRLRVPVLRTSIGSPFVIAGMEALRRSGHRGILGFEANGGVLLGDDVKLAGGTLSALPTRDCFLPLAAVLSLAAAKGCALSALVSELALPITATAKIEGLPQESLRACMDALNTDDCEVAEVLQPLGTVATLDRTDGIRAVMTNGIIVFLRPSGNEPALRVYVEAESEAEAQDLLVRTAALVRDHLAHKTNC